MSDTWCYARNCWGPNLRDLFGNRVLREVTKVKGAFGVGRRPREGQVRARTGSEGTRGAGERGSGGSGPHASGGAWAWRPGRSGRRRSGRRLLSFPAARRPHAASQSQPWGCSAPALRRRQVEMHGGRLGPRHSTRTRGSKRPLRKCPAPSTPSPSKSPESGA